MRAAEAQGALALILSREARLSRGAAVLSVAGSALWIAQAAVIAAAIVQLMGQGGLAPLPAAILLFGLAALRAGVEAVAQRLTQSLSARVGQGLRARLAAHVLRLSPAGQDEDHAGLASLAGEGIAQIGPWVERYRPARLRVMVLSPLILVLTLTQSWAAGLALALTGPLIPVFMALVGWAAEAASRRHLVKQGALNRLLLDRIAALIDLRLLGAVARARDDLARQSADLHQHSMAVLRLAFLSSAVLEFFAALGVALVAVHVGLSLLGLIDWGAWGAGLSPFGGIFVLLIAPDFYQPLRDLAATWHDRANAEAAAAAVDRELARGDLILGAGGAGAPVAGSLVWRGLGVTRADQRIGFPDGTLAPGEAVALTGASGTGKTTLLLALAGLLRAGGEVRQGDRSLDDATADTFRAGLCLIPQVPRFPDLPLSEWLDPGGRADPSAVAAALCMLGVDAAVAALPDGLQTRLGETGGGVSGGEARRLLVARALIAQPAIVLADEPTADLDADTAAAVTGALFSLRGQGTALLVATHDTALIARMDRAIRLEAGA
ncbi:ATP-binding cassette domain-containing protein [Neotabrizicola shimadae]|uniref:ATP-binding cassette domain-containing protein n=1 Tax=Neotabrizicola shimadae TaxID=2807096 RepID=A0A8G0ZVE5_9RHOB|nr:ATP-binding cassette domain-containing protein [Neotabrizicola shimadae]QYZ69562.1 ATP-binding cassette domain-containing protein [Neotabrizicola shimadae]